jgi:DNA-directed RNA polymerase specialized sigma24 family protein
MDFNDPSVDRLRLKLRYKVLYHVGHNCPDVEDLVQETLVRFFRAEQRQTIRNNPEEFGAFLNGICRNVILEYRRRVRREPFLDPDIPIPDTGIRPEAEILERRYLPGVGHDRCAVSRGPVPGEGTLPPSLRRGVETKNSGSALGG